MGKTLINIFFFFMLWSGLCGKNKGNNIWICFDGGPQTHKSDLSIRLCLDASISIKIPFLLLGIRYISMQKVHSWKCTFPPAHLLLTLLFAFCREVKTRKWEGGDKRGTGNALDMKMVSKHPYLYYYYYYYYYCYYYLKIRYISTEMKIAKHSLTSKWCHFVF